MSELAYKLSIDSDLQSNIHDKITIEAKAGVSASVVQSCDNTSGTSLQNMKFVVLPPIHGGILDTSSVKIRLPMQAIVGITSTAVYDATGSNDAGSAELIFPSLLSGHAQLSALRAIDNLSVSVNQQRIQRVPKDYFNSLSLFTELKNDTQSPEFSMPDFANDYAVYTTQGLNSITPMLNVFCDDYSNNEFQSRGSFDEKVLCDAAGTPLAPGARGKYVRLRWVQTVTIPLEFFNSMQGIHNVNEFSVDMSFNAAYYTRVLACTSAVAAKLESVSLSAYEIPRMHYRFVVPKTFYKNGMTNAAGEFKTQVLKYSDIWDYKSNGVSVAAGVSATIPSALVPSSRVPSKVYVWAEHSTDAASTADKLSTPETYGLIEKLNLSYGDNPVHLSTLDKKSLWEMTARNGFVHRYSSLKHVGSVICIDFSRDIGLSDKVVGQSTSQSAIKLDVTVKNLTSKVQNMVLHTVVQYEHMLEITNTTSNLRDSVALDASDVEKLGNLLVTDAKKTPIIAGGIGSALWNIGKGLIKSGPELMKIVGNFTGGAMVPNIAGKSGGCAPVTASTTKKKAGGIDKPSASGKSAFSNLI